MRTTKEKFKQRLRLSVRRRWISRSPPKNMVEFLPSPNGFQDSADGVPTNTETGRQRKSSHGLLALRRSTTTPTTIVASAVDLTPHLHSRSGRPAGTTSAMPAG